MMNKTFALVLMVIVLFVTSVVVSTSLIMSNLKSQPSAVVVSNLNLPDFTKIYQKQNDSVVSIMVTRPKTTAEDADEDKSADHPVVPAVPGDTKPKIAHILGSGFVISKDGFIVTNAHVVFGADTVMVKFIDRHEYFAKIIGLDQRTDVALLKIDGNNLQTSVLGNSDNVKIGEWVIAIGSPFGLLHSLTAGIVNAKDRQIESDSIVPFIQTDVPINPGNSGGPLLNMNGEVVGINSQIYSRSGGFMGISFAIPINTVMFVVNQLHDSGKVVFGHAGVELKDLSSEDASAGGVSPVDHVPQVSELISKVERMSAADAAGLKPGDIILQVNGRSETTTAELSRIIAMSSPNSIIKLRILRGEKILDINLLIG